MQELQLLWLEPEHAGSFGSQRQRRNVKAWAIGPGGTSSNLFALEARNAVGLSESLLFSGDGSVFRAFSASKNHSIPPGALPQAFTFRAFGAKTQSLHPLALVGGAYPGTPPPRCRNGNFIFDSYFSGST